MGYDDVGTCPECCNRFNYLLLHNGFNDSAYAYCDKCGKTAVFSYWSGKTPEKANVKFHQKIEAEIEPFIQPCDCGGRFTHDANPRCPQCLAELSAVDCAEFIENNAPGTVTGWRWQRNWEGLYCIAIEGKDVLNNWK